jgi:hypothetical protein
MSAAAFTKGLLDLEGSSLTPILVSLVKKDASMLDAFGKARGGGGFGPSQPALESWPSPEPLALAGSITAPLPPLHP